MKPELALPLFGVEIKAYALFTVLGALAFAASALPLLRRAGVKPLRALALLIAMAVAFLVGARLWNRAVNPGAYGGALKWYSFRLAGFSLYGGLLGSALALAAWARLCGERPFPARLLPLLDAIVVPMALAFASARVGCFLNGCCGGVSTTSFWGVAFPAKNSVREALSGLLLFHGAAPPVRAYPTQLFELAFAMLGLFPVLLLGRRLKPGSGFLLYSAWFSVGRLGILPLRSLPYSDVVKNAVYPALYIVIAALCIAGLLFIKREMKGLASSNQ